MTNLYRHNHKKNRSGLIIATVLVVLIIGVDWLSGGSIRSLVRVGAVWAWEVSTHTGQAITGSGLFSSRRALEKENRTLREEITKLNVRAAAFEVLREENEALRGLVDVASEAGGVSARIVSTFRSSPYGTFLIGAGTEHGVQEGSVVIAGDTTFGGFVVGRVQSADARTSLVKALFAPGETVDAVVREIGITLEGRGGGQARSEAPREALIETGDVVTSSLAGGRAVGLVGHVEKDPGGAAQRLFVHLPISMTALTYVYVVSQ